MLGCQVQIVQHSRSLFTKTCESVIMMLEPCLEVVVENVITAQNTCKQDPELTRLLTVTWFSVHSLIILYSQAVLRKKYFPTLQV